MGLETYIRIKKVNGRGGDVTHTKLEAIVDKATRKDNNVKLLFKLFGQKWQDIFGVDPPA